VAFRFGWLPALALVAALPATGGQLAWKIDESFGESGRGRNELKEPVDLALTPDGTVAVLDRDREAVVLFSEAGRWLRTLGGTRGTGEVKLDRPTAIAVDRGGRIWIVDSRNHRLVVIDEVGKVIKEVGSLGSAEGRFRHPADLTFDGRGRLYVADAGNERVQVFTEEGEFLASWDRRTGGRRDHLETPLSLAYSDQGRGGVWVLNRGWKRLERFDRDGNWEESLDLPQPEEGDFAPVAIEVEQTFYRMFLADAVGGRIVALDRRGAFQGEIRGPEGGFDPRGLAVTRRMDVYAADLAGARVLRFREQ